MNENLQNEKLFPVDKNEQDSLKQLAEKLDKMNAKNKTPQASETIGDDFDVDVNKLKMIEKSEAEMRILLKLMDMDYDALIRMDGKSIYSRAVNSNSAVLEHVKNAENPVLEAVKISLQFKPYAEFMEKYGQEPTEIFKNIKQELEGQVSEQKKTEKPFIQEQIEGAPFSGISNLKAEEAKQSEMPSLNEIFKNKR
jgi:nitrogenase molybdenum-iron protein alpha/beta subunit